MRVLVIGAGIVGAAMADALARRGHAVTVVDRAGAGGAASAASFGWINASFAETDGYFRLRAGAVEAWRALGLARMTGALWFEEDGAAFDAQVDVLRRRGHPHAVIGANRVREREPAVADPPSRAILTPTEGAVAPERAARVLLERSGATLLAGATVERLVPGGVETDRGALRADHVVVAAGTACAALTGLPMRAEPGLIVRTRPVAPVLRGVVMGPDVHFRQDPDGRVVLGEVFAGAAPEGADAEGFAQEMVARLRRRLPGVAGLAVETIHLGTRPVPEDGLPLIGPLPGRPGVTVMAMHSGATLAPHVAALASAELGGEARAALEPFRPARLT